MADGDKGLAKNQGHCHGRPHCNPHRSRLQDGNGQSAPQALVPASKVQTARNRQQDQRRNCRPGDTSRCSVVPPLTQPLPDMVVAGKYRLLNRIGQGSFGELYRAEGIKYGELVAVKLERSAVRHPLLAREAKIYGILQGGVGIPHMRYYGTEGEFNVMVMDLLGPTLEDLLNLCSRNFSMRTTLMLADQILDRIEFLHVKCFVHRDVKPDNFLMGRGRHSPQVYMIDFGLAKKFYSKSSQQHIDYIENKELVGTARYASVRAHYAEQSRRDDLESVGYLLIYFRRGRLPWQGIQAETEAQKYERIAESKASVPLDVLCSGLPMEFLLYLQYCRNLHFQQKPDYQFLRELFKTVFRNQYKRFDLRYDWDLKRLKQAQYTKEGDSRVQRAREGNRNGETDRARNRKAETVRKDLTGRRNQDQERNLATDRAGPRNREPNRAGYTHRERGRDRDRDRDQDRGRERCLERGRQDCACSYHRHLKRLRDRQPGPATERRKNVPGEPPSSHRQPPPGL